MKKILLTPRAFNNFGEDAIEKIRKNGYEPVVNDTGNQLSKEEFRKLAVESTGIVIGVDLLDEDILKECKNLKAVVKFGVGLDNIDVDYAANNGIKVERTLGTNSNAVAEFTIGLLFSSARNIVNSSIDVRGGKWIKPTGVELKGKTIGIIGFGNIGKEVGRIAKGIGMNVLAYDAFPIKEENLAISNATSVDLQTLLKESDFITIHVPLLEETKDLISSEEFRLMKKNVILVNSARGGVVNEKALYEALINKEIGSAASDVFTTEPPVHEDWIGELIKLDNFTLTPHIASRTYESEINTINLSTQILLDALK